MSTTKIGVIGSGAWGTALAQVLAGDSAAVTLWARRGEVADAINKTHENPSLPGIKLNPAIRATTNLHDAAKSDVILVVTPAQHVRTTLAALKPHIKPQQYVVICAKGIEAGSGALLSQVAHEEIRDATVAILTGPNFASEIVRGLPSASTIAASKLEDAQKISSLLARRTLRPYATDDIIGAQVGGAVKNVIAIACGIVIGAGLGESARAALMTRGLAEIARLCANLGGRRETLMGMCGVGDLMLTSSSPQSRNYSLGLQLGGGKSLEAILAERKGVTEGVHTARAVMIMANRLGVDMPISQAVNRCLNENLSIKDAMASMLERPLREEAF